MPDRFVEVAHCTGPRAAALEAAREPQRRAQVRTGMETIAGLTRVQVAAKGAMLLEGRSMDIPIKDEIFDGHGQVADVLGRGTRQAWRTHGARLPNGRPLCADHVILLPPPATDNRCRCGRQASSYAARG